MPLTQIQAAGIAADAIDESKIADDGIDSEHYNNGSIDHEHLANDAVDGDNIADDAINSEHYAAGSIDLEHMSSESVDEDNLKISNAGSNGQFLQKQSGNTGGLTWAAPTSRILDQFYTPCDGSTIAAAGGDITVQNVTGSQNSTATFADLPGSTIAYTPPSGTTHVIYEFMMHSAGTGGNNAVNASFRFMIDGTEVTNARWAMAGNNVDQHPVFKWGINIGGTAVPATGRQSSWSSDKTLKLQYRDYNGSNKICVAHNLYTWEASVDVDIFSQPCIGITAIG